MVRRVQCVCLALLATLAQAEDSSSLVPDSSDLIQVAARVREDEESENPTLKESMEKLQQVAVSSAEKLHQLKRNSTEKLQQLQHNWTEHVKKRIAALDQEKAEKAARVEEERKAEEEKRKAQEEALKAEAAKREAEEARAIAQQKAADEEAAETEREYKARSLRAQKNAAIEAERQAAQVLLRQEEDKRAGLLAAKRMKFGDELNITVKSPLGDFSTTVWSSTRLQALMKSVGNKLDFDYTQATFSVNGRTLDPMHTPKETGLIDQDVVLVSGPGIERLHEEREKLALDRKAEEEAAEAEAAARELQKHRMDARNAAKASAARREQQLKEDGRIKLQFIHEEGGVQKKQVDLAVKKSNALQGSMDLVVKRLGLDPAKARFQLLNNQQFAVGKDTPLSLGLKENAVIIVKTPWKKH